MIIKGGRDELEQTPDTHRALETFKEHAGKKRDKSWVLATLCVMEDEINLLKNCSSSQENEIRDMRRQHISLTQQYRQAVAQLDELDGMRQRMQLMEQRLSDAENQIAQGCPTDVT